MNNDQLIIDERKESIKEEKERIEAKKSTFKFSNFLNKFGRGFFGVTGALLLVGGMPGVGFAFMTTALANHIALKNRGIAEENKLALLKKEEEHITKITKEPIDGSKALTKRRVRKVNELVERKKKTSSKSKFYKVTDVVSNLLQWAALTTAVCVPPLSWVAGISVAAKYLTSKGKVESAKEDDTLALRINNLNLDLEATKAIAPTQRAAAETAYEKETSLQADTKKEKASYKVEDERLVDAYIASLENVGEIENPKQLVK